jgi:hypothetical protein
MLEPREFFEQLLSPFVIKPIMDYTFQINFGLNTSIGCEFLSLMIFNLFISEPGDAIQDVIEANFGF